MPPNVVVGSHVRIAYHAVGTTGQVADVVTLLEGKPVATTGPRPGGSLLKLVLLDLLAEGVAVDAEVLGGARQVAAVLQQDSRDEPLLELPLRLGEADPLVDHLDDERFQLLLHETSTL
jgi:hypothetical protein